MGELVESRTDNEFSDNIMIMLLSKENESISDKEREVTMQKL